MQIKYGRAKTTGAVLLVLIIVVVGGAIGGCAIYKIKHKEKEIAKQKEKQHNEGEIEEAGQEPKVNFKLPSPSELTILAPGEQVVDMWFMEVPDGVQLDRTYWSTNLVNWTETTDTRDLSEIVREGAASGRQMMFWIRPTAEH